MNDTNKMSEFEKELKKQMDLQFQRGMYTAAYGISGAINGMIEQLKAKPKKRLVDYQKTIADIARLCQVKLNNPDQKPEEPSCK